MANTLVQAVLTKLNSRYALSGASKTADVQIKRQPVMNRYHGYVVHEVVERNGREIGRFQTRVERGQVEVLTISNGRTRRGRDLDLLVRLAEMDETRHQWLGLN